MMRSRKMRKGYRKLKKRKREKKMLNTKERQCSYYY